MRVSPSVQNVPVLMEAFQAGRVDCSLACCLVVVVKSESCLGPSPSEGWVIKTGS